MANPFDTPPGPGVVRLRLGLLWLMMPVLAAGIFGAYGYMKHGGFQPVREFLDKDNAPWPAWFKQKVSYEPEPVRVVETNHAPPRDLNAEAIARLNGRLTAMEQKLDMLANRPPPTPVKPVQQEKPKRISMLSVSHELKEEKTAAPNTYTLAPGATKIPCQVETAITSDVEGYLTAKVTSAVYDTATGKHLLIPQNSTPRPRSE
jgi:type IV secretory pathway VirB10-like protein